MRHPNNTHLVTVDLNNYLRSNNYFDVGVQAHVNAHILELWSAKFISAIRSDFSSKFSNLTIEFKLSRFELESENEQGSPCVFFHQISLCDRMTSEQVRAFVKTQVNFNKTFIFLDSEYSNVDKWVGNSKALKSVFDKLKGSDKKFGYFLPVTLADIVK